jgi:hypothetical protein
MRFLRVALLPLLACFVRAEDIETLKHEVYKNATITRTEPDGLVITYSAGIVKIPFAELSEDYKRRFGYNAEAAESFTKATEQEQDAIYLNAHPEVATKDGEDKLAAAERQSAEFDQKWQEAPLTNYDRQLYELRGNVFFIEAKVIQVLEKGVLISHPKMKSVLFHPNQKADFRSTIRTDYVGPVADVMYLEVNPGKYFDGDRVRETFVFDYGGFRYADTGGASRKVRALTANVEHALEHLRESQSTK